MFIYIYSCENPGLFQLPVSNLAPPSGRKADCKARQKGSNEERAGRERIRKGFLFTSHDAARESPAQRLFYKGDLQGCILTGRYLETKIAVAL